MVSPYSYISHKPHPLSDLVNEIGNDALHFVTVDILLPQEMERPQERAQINQVRLLNEITGDKQTNKQTN